MIDAEDQQIEETPQERPDWPGAQPKQAAFLTAFVLTGHVWKAARAAKIARCLHYKWKNGDPNYAELFALAREMAADLLEGNAIEMCNDGVEEPVYYMGVEVGRIKRYPYGMHQFLLRGLKPEVYRDRVEHTGKDGGPIASNITVTFVKP